MKNRSMFVNILIVIGIFLAGNILLSLILGVLGIALGIAIKILLPLAIAVWLVRTIVNPSRKKRRYY